MPESKKAAEISGLVAWYGAPGEIRTPDPQVRSLVLYPTELRAQIRSEIMRCYLIPRQRKVVLR